MKKQIMKIIINAKVHFKQICRSKKAGDNRCRHENLVSKRNNPGKFWKLLKQSNNSYLAQNHSTSISDGYFEKVLFHSKQLLQIG